MAPFLSRIAGALSLCLCLAPPLRAAEGTVGPESPAAPAALEFFENEIRPLLATRCYECHGGSEKIKGGLRLNSRGALIAGGESGPAATPGKPQDSLLIEAVNYRGLQMPPSGKLPAVEADKLARWIEMGMPWPAESNDSAAVRPPDSAFAISEQQRNHWSFRPLQDSATPAVNGSTWPAAGSAGEIDRFVLARLEAAGLRPNPPADRRTLLRRATFDLTGLPPTPDEFEQFVADSSPGAWATVVDRLLASADYGPRWGRHWLDLAHYADTAGETADYPIREAYLYRDYVIASIQQDKPYDQFLREQIAGDILAETAPPERRGELLIATGYLASARRFGFDPQNYHHLTIADMLETLGRSVLALSLGCARCHDHKYDPISSADYYSLYGIFNSTRYAFPGSEEKKRPQDFLPLTPEPEASMLRRRYQAQLDHITAELKSFAADKSPDAADAAAQLAELTRVGPYPVAYGVAEGQPADARVQIRGEPTRLGAAAPRRFLEILGGDKLERPNQGSGRAELADWLTRPSNPLTARVIVNRVWQQHFGKGIAPDVSDFGLRGRVPTHPELLDYLAARFMAEGWSLKRLHRTMMLSQTYQLSSAPHPQAEQVDPENTLLARFARRRLDAESIRDAALAASGQLDRSPAGPHPFPPLETWNFTQHKPFQAVYESHKRSVYLMVQRNARHPFLSLFDGADPNVSTGERLRTTTPTQALFLMNDPFVHEQSAALARRLLRERLSEEERLTLAHQLICGREPDAAQRLLAMAFLAEYRSQTAARLPDAEQQASAVWAAYARVLLASNEFLFVD